MHLIDSELSQPLQACLNSIPPGRWAVAVSGGADSVALFRLVSKRSDLFPHIVHLDHELRGLQSEHDAEFARLLAAQFKVHATITNRTAIERAVKIAESCNADRAQPLHANKSAHFRALRLALYRRVVEEEGLAGVLLAHHADDQAETVLLRLLRGAGYPALVGIAPVTEVGGVTIRRPLLSVSRTDLRAFLKTQGQSWREDPSNQSDVYGRNRVRKALNACPQLLPLLLAVAEASGNAREWVRCHAPTLTQPFPQRMLADVPAVLGDASLADWLVRHGVPADLLSPAHISSIGRMCRDAASPCRQSVPGGRIVGRSGGLVSVTEPTA
jgi:tRNA(Ile)-lysidine synthetase-like protein